ncbi:MAG: hypothetical protein ACJ8AH_13490 [Stellaceae bacterium]
MFYSIRHSLIIAPITAQRQALLTEPLPFVSHNHQFVDNNDNIFYGTTGTDTIGGGDGDDTVGYSVIPD